MRQDNIDAIKLAAIELGLFPAGTPIYGLNEKKKAVVTKKGKWVNFFDHIKAEYANKHVDFDLMLQAGGAKEFLYYDGDVPNAVFKNWTTDYDTSNNQEWLTFFKRLEELKAVNCSNVESLYTLVKHWTMIHKDFKAMYEYRHQIGKQWAKIMEDNESLKFINMLNASADPKGIKLIIEAIS